KSDGQSTGKSSEEIAAVLGVSTRTAERMRNIINNADDETLEAVKSGTVSISKADKITTEKKKNKERKVTEKSDDISEALEENSGKPSVLNFNHSDGIERPTNRLSAEEDSARTSERRCAYESGFVDGFQQAALYIFGELKKEISIEEIEKEFDGAKKTFTKLSSFIDEE
ncbi:helix-turn-helix transcriptional regulator, partial [Treponema pectinovorum]|uniref:helix-turn-helix transcriptional regulator n=1 Tax=Treponema pectinovorum TaxID=164 RepID=UPI0016596B99